MELERTAVFVAYATVDGFSHAEQLVDWLDHSPLPIDAFIDRDNRQDASWETRIENAISGSDLMLVVLTDAVVAADSWARKEILYATGLNKPIYGVRPPGSRAQLTLSGQGGGIIDLSPDRGGWDHLEHELSLWWPANNTVARQIDRLHDIEARIAQSAGAERDVLRKEAGRISTFIQAEQRRAADPAAATRKVDRLIHDGQARDASHPADALSDGPLRVVGRPPAISGGGLHDRNTERDAVLDHLRDEATRLVTLCGPSGAGKTALVSHLIPRLRRLGYVGAVYVSTHGPRRVTVELLLEKLARAHPDAKVSTLLLERIADVSYNWIQKLSTILEAFGDRPLLLIIDNAEELVDDRRLADLHLRELVYTVMHREGHGLRLLLVSRIDGPPAEDGTGGIRQVPIPPTLPPPFAEAFVRELDAGNVVGLERASESAMSRIHQLTDDRPRALELMYAVLRSERQPDLDELLNSAAAESAETDDGARYLMRRAIARLSGPLRRVVQALAIYGRPVRPSAVSWLLAGYDAGLDSTKALELLCGWRLVRRDGEFYYLPPDPTSATVLETIPLGEPHDRLSAKPRFSCYALWDRAAEYFRSVRKCLITVRRLGDLDPHFSEIDLRLKGGDYSAAAILTTGIDTKYLAHWGYRSLVLSQRECLIGNLPTDHGEIANRYELGTIYLHVTRPEAAIKVLTEAVDLASTRRPDAEVARLQLQLAKAHYNLGSLRKAAATYAEVLERCTDDALAVARIGRAACLAELGAIREAFDLYSAALEVATMPDVEASARLSQGLIRRDLGKPLDALVSIERARVLAVGHSDVLAAKCLDASADVLIDTGRLHRACELADQAIRSATDAGDVDLARETYSTLALAHLLGGDHAAACEAASAAARFFDNKRPLAALALLGVAQVRRGDARSAAHSFGQANREADRLLKIEPKNVQVLDISGLVLAGLARCDPAEEWSAAIRAYRRARKRTRAPGIVLRTVRLLDELLADDRSSQAVATRQAARGCDPE